MENQLLKSAQRCYKGGLWDAMVAAICCFTPILVIGLGFPGLAAFTPYLDLVLFPLLGLPALRRLRLVAEAQVHGNNMSNEVIEPMSHHSKAKRQ